MAIARNAPCSCGSGKRYKNCCGSLQDPIRESSSTAVPMYPGWDQLSADQRNLLWETMQGALEAQKAGDQDRAKRIYESVLEVAPDTFDAVHMLAVVEMEHGNFDRAEELLVRAIALFPTTEMRSNLALTRRRRQDQDGIYSLRSVVAADALALFAAHNTTLSGTDCPDALLLRPQAARAMPLHIVMPGDVLNPGCNRTAIGLRDHCLRAGMAVTLWRNAPQGVPKVAVEGVRDIERDAEALPSGGLLAITGLDAATVEWLPQCIAHVDECYLLMDAHVPQSLVALFGQLPAEALARLRLVARTEETLAQWGLRGIVDPFLLCGQPTLDKNPVPTGRPRFGVFIQPRGGYRDRERWEMLNWLRAQGIFIRILYPGRLPSRHIADDEEHLVSLVTDWDDSWAADLDALFFWGTEGRSHQFDTLLVEAKAAGMMVVRDAYAESAGPEAREEFFFTTDEARTALAKLIGELSR